MNISMDRFGRIVQAGEGMFRVPVGVGQVDNTLSNPVSQAEELASQERAEYATMAAMAQVEAEDQAAAAAHQAWLQALATDYTEFVAEESAAENGGENPLLYSAAFQTMAGTHSELTHPLMGYLLSQDGQPAWDRTMNGQKLQALGQSVQSLIQSATSDYQQGQALATAVTGGGSAPAPASAAPGAPAVPATASGISALMSQKVGGIPVPYIGAAVLAFLILKR